MNESHKQQKSTTVVAIKNDDSVVIGADRQVSGRRLLEDDKLFQLHPKGVLGTSGFVTDIQTLVSDVKKHQTEYRIRRGREMSASTLLTYLREKLNPGSGYSLPEYLAVVLYVGFDSEPIIGKIGPAGTKTTDEDYLVAGSGGSVARGVVASDYEDNMTTEEIRGLAVDGLRVAADEGVATGVGIDIAIVSEDGVEMEKEIQIER